MVITAGAGTTVHADEYTHTILGSGKTQLVKLVDGTLNAEAAVAVDVGVKANALRVAPASDITDATYIGDIKFGESLPAGTAAIGKLAANSGVDIGDVDVLSIAAGDNNIGNVDVVSQIPGTGATNLGKAVDAVAGATDTGVAALAIRDDTLGALTPVEGDYVPLRVNSTGALHVTGGGGGTQYAVDDALGATPTGTVAIAIRDDALSALTPVEGDAIGLRVDANGALWTHDDALDAVLGGSELQVDVVAALPAGTNAIGKLAANSGVDIGDVDVASIAAGTNLIGKVSIDQVTANANEVVVKSITAGDANIGNVDIVTVPAPLSVVGTGLEATAMRVTIATDSTGVLSVDDNGGALTVDGTVTAELSAVDNAVLDTIDAVLDTINAKLVTGTDIGDVTINNAAGAAAVNVQDGGNALTVDGTVTASNTAGDIAHDGADSGNPVKVGGKAYNMDGTAPGTPVAEADRANFITDTEGRQLVETTHPNFWSVPVNYTVAQTNTAIKAAPGASLSLYITDVVCSNGAVAGNMKFVEDTAGTPVDRIEVMYFAINGGAALHFRTPIKITANKDFGITSVTSTTHSVTVCGYTAP